MSKSKGRRLAEWLRNLDSSSLAGTNTLADDSVGSDQLAHDLALQGNPTAATQSSGNNSTRLATTAFVTDATSGLATDSNVANKAPINSPTFTGVPAGPTANAGTNTTQLATTAFVTTAVAGASVAGISSSADATAITIDSSENVGIGTTNPDSLFHVGTGTNTDGTDVTITIGGDSANTRQSLITKKIQSGDRALQIHAAGGSSDEDIRFFSDSSTERMRIDSSGRLLVNITDATTGSQNPTVNIKQLTNNSYHRGLIIESTDSDAFIGIGYSGSEFQIGATYRASAGYKPITITSGGYERVRFPTAGGITFNGDTASANALDDYEEGTWTPAYGVSTGSFGSITHSTQTGYYTKVGNVCTCHGRLDSSSMSIGSASNYLFITGFPFASKTGAYQSGVISYAYGYTSVWANAVAFQGSTSYVYLFSVDDGANSSTIGPSNLGTGQTYLYFSITYITN